jgi:hypothetical protein
MLYDDDCPQNRKTEKQILTGKHVLSPDIKVFPFVVVDNEQMPICRCLMTYYKSDPTAYVGFFESEDDIDAVHKMFISVERRAKKDGKTKLIGPIDASIYINYRFKENHFDRTYTGEPYNQPYYRSLWTRSGFTISDRYVSNQMRQVEEKDFDSRLEKIYNRYVEKGYEFRNPNADNFESCLVDVHKLLMDSYSGFPGYKPMTKSQFVKMYSSIKRIVNYDMVQLVYRDNQLRAFCIAVPNYYALTRGRMTPIKLLKIIRIKKNPKEYVILYVGADKKTPGLGGALMHSVRNSLYKNKCTSIGALIHEGNVTDEIYQTLHQEQYRYVLLRKEIPVDSDL